MPIYKDSNNIGELYFAGNQIGEAYCGSNLVYQNKKIVYLSSGNGTYWNLKSLYPSLYSKLSTDNFYFTGCGDISITDSFRNAEGETGYQTITHGRTKTYNASNGNLNFYNWLGNNDSTAYGGLRAVLVTKPSKLYNLGTGTSFNVRGYSGYQNFNVNNFLIKDWSPYNSNYIIHGFRGLAGDWIASDSKTLVKSYNSSTGVLTCYFRDVGSTNIGESWDYVSNCTVYLTLDRPK